MAERVAASGYAALGVQTNATTPAIPSVFTPYYKQNMETNLNLISDKPVYGSKFQTFQMLQGTRSHKGTISVMAEPVTAEPWLDMLLTKLSTTGGSDPFTHTFGLSTTVDPNFYTLDISLVSQVIRFFGVGASKLGFSFQNEELQFDMSLSGLGSFYGREVASISGSGPYTITFTTTYDPAPTTGLVATDLLYVKSSTGAYVDIATTLTSLTPTTITVPASPSLAGVTAGDYVTLRPQTVSLTTQTPFIWPLTNYYFGASSTAALASSTQTRLESGSATPTIMHNFENDDGSKRSGAFDPASLIRTVGGYDFKIKQYFDKTDQLKQWQAINKQACVMRCFSGTNHQLYMVMNNIKQTQETIQTQFADVIYQEETYGPQYDTTDGTGMSLVLINGTST